ncbi:hypothetical protein KSZ_48560 [Dictyobacter formicarum]|uniref:Uncharacterized protein n=1 Tax=Dictyobacter formicarum TaxID=2778368 RepID=A0ABQ3VM31_9CHLR|nr:hypothetical protein KSZ_48560 [Dictyobacter formicarum]
MLRCRAPLAWGTQASPTSFSWLVQQMRIRASAAPAMKGYPEHGRRANPCAVHAPARKACYSLYFTPMMSK